MLGSGVKALRGGVVCTFRWKLVGPMGGNMKGKERRAGFHTCPFGGYGKPPYVSTVLASERQKT